jgi:hypothetical protein
MCQLLVPLATQLGDHERLAQQGDGSYCALYCFPFRICCSFRCFYLFCKESLQKVSSCATTTICSLAEIAGYLRVFLRLHRDHWINSWLGGWVCALSLLCEQAERRAEVAIYCMPRVMEIFYGGAVKRGWIGYFRGGDVALFCLALGTLLSFLQHDRAQLSPGTRFILSKTFGKT